MLFRATRAAYGSSQARGQIEAAALSPHQQHTGSGPHLRPTSQLTAIPDPLREARDRTCIHKDTSLVGNPLSHNGTCPLYLLHCLCYCSSSSYTLSYNLGDVFFTKLQSHKGKGQWVLHVTMAPRAGLAQNTRINNYLGEFSSGNKCRPKKPKKPKKQNPHNYLAPV